MLCFGMSASANNELAATGQCGDNVYWNYDSTTGGLIVSGTGKMYDYPNFVDYSPFYDTEIKTVIVEEGITSIGDGAFENCESLEVATIPDGVTRIGDDAFRNCTNLSNVTLPDDVKSIGDSAFSSCYGFTSLIIPDSVTSIGINAFLGCNNISSITIPDSVVSLGRGAFDRCSAATTITIGKSVKKIDISTFNECDKVESIYIPAGVTQIESSAFSDCYSLKEFVVDENNKNYISEQGILFNKDKTQLVKYPSSKEGAVYTVPESVESIGDFEVFGHCNNLEKIVLGSKITSLGDFIFQDCENLKYVEFLGNLTTINYGAFWGCKSLTDIDIPDSVTSIESNAFWTCDSLKIVSIPANVTHIEEEAFGFCTNLENIIVDENNNYYSDENGVLYNKDKSILVQYPAGKKDSNYTLNVNTSVIGEYALAYNEYLETVELNQTLTEIKSNAFISCSNLSNVYCYGEDYNWSEIFTDEDKHLIVDANVICYELEKDVLFVLGVIGNTDIDESSYYPWSQYATSTEQIILKDIARVSSGVFANFANLTTVIIDGDDVYISAGTFQSCTNLNMVVSYASLYFSKKAVSDIGTTVNVFANKAKNEYTNYILFEFISSADDDFVLGEEKIGVYIDGKVRLTEAEFKQLVSALYYGSNNNFFNVTFKNLFVDGSYIYQYEKLSPLVGVSVENQELSEVRVFAIMETAPESNEYLAITMQDLCDALSNDELPEFDYKFAIEGQIENEDEKKPNGIMGIFATVLEAIKKIFKIIAKLFK